jgi:signal transduction histidine kinase
MKAMKPMERTPNTGYRALVVDDEVALAGIVASYLEREHFDVSVAHDGHDALSLAREIDPDVVVLDLAQVLGNLLDNSLRHTPRGGLVDVAARADDSRLAITVTDSGDGIAAEHLPHVFERFYRVDAARDRDHGGAGIGLAIAKALVQAHRGRLTVSSDGPGTGTTFTITLPLGRTEA